ncbi:MAG: polysaccharide biosynthesis tyrosine autokinase [Solirubrobacteraceae bacterium]|nr:polysaccharide biosynthesis tyrosine autokinase [Solirubrobacteraceae bacterium]
MPTPESTASGALENAAAARLIRRVLKQWPLIIGCAVLAALAGYFASSSRTETFEATTTLQLNEIDYSAVLLGQNLQQQGQDAETKSATNAKLVTLPNVLRATAARLGGRIDAAGIGSAVTVSAEPSTTLIEITARNPDPQLAADIANQIRKEFIEQRRTIATGQAVRARINVQRQLEALNPEERDSVAGQALQQRLGTIGSIVDFAGPGISTADVAERPTVPASPKPKRDAVLALIAGGLLGLGIALLRARLDDRVREASEFTEMWDLPLVGSVPKSGDLVDEGRTLPGGAVLEAFALARTNLRYLHVGGDVKTVVVTSSIAEEGKSTVTWNLALSTAVADGRVLVIEADMRRPALSARLGLPAKDGLAEVLAGMIEVDRAIVKVPFTDPTRGLEGSVDVLPAGQVPPSPIALLERDRLGAVLDAVKARYDLVLIDTPPTTVVADSLIIARHVDGVLVVSRLQRVRRGQYERLRDQLLDTETPVLGQLVNGDSGASSYGYSSYYGKQAVAQ